MFGCVFLSESPLWLSLRGSQKETPPILRSPESRRASISLGLVPGRDDLTATISFLQSAGAPHEVQKETDSYPQPQLNFLSFCSVAQWIPPPFVQLCSGEGFPFKLNQPNKKVPCLSHGLWAADFLDLILFGFDMFAHFKPTTCCWWVWTDSLCFFVEPLRSEPQSGSVRKKQSRWRKSDKEKLCHDFVGSRSDHLGPCLRETWPPAPTFPKGFLPPFVRHA